MSPAGSETPADLGDLLRVRTGRVVDPRRGLVAAEPFEEALAGWRVLLRDRHTQLVAEGEELEAWVFALDKDEHRILVSADDFGRLPVSDKMRERYLCALRDVGSLFTGAAPTEELIDHVSEVKGIYGRVLKRDQRDWFTVFKALGRPDREEAKAIRAAFDRLRKTLTTDGKPALVVEELRGLRAPEQLHRAAMDLAEEEQGLQRARVLRPIAERAAPVMEPRGGYVFTAVSRAKQERANAEHEQLVRSLAAALQLRGLASEESELIDLFCRLPTGPAIYEIKTTTARNWRRQLRAALAQLLEYRFIYALDEAALFAVLSARPPEEWAIDFLAANAVEALWWQDGRFHGSGVAAALGDL